MLIVDAYNVLHQTGVLSPHLAGLDVPGLVRLLSHSRYASRKTTLVCDGGGSKGSGVRMGHVNVLFSGYHAEADDLIETLIERYVHGGGLSVVSSDKRLRRAAKKRGAEIIPSDRLLRHLEHDADRPEDRGGLPVFVHEIPLDRWSVAHWMEEFGIEPDDTPKQVPRPAPASAAAKTNHPKRVEPSRVSQSTPSHARADREQRAKPEPAQDLDPLLRAALEEWRGRLTADDLDMRRWVDDVKPISDRTRPRG